MSSQYDITQQFLNGGVVPADLVGQETVSKTYVDGKVGSQNAEIAIIAGLAATAQNTANVGVSAAGAAQSTATSAVGAAGVAQHTAEVAQTTIETHKISTKAHDSLYITYSGPVAGASSVKQALDLTKQRVDNIVASGGESNVEIVDARQPATGDAFPVLGARLNNVDTQLAEGAQGSTAVKNRLIGGFVAHRGLQPVAPENTIKAIRAAAEAGFAMVEIDPTQTSDLKWVLSHDPTVDRMTDGTGSVASMTLAQIQSLKIDTPASLILEDEIIRMPTLQEALEEISSHGMGVNIDGSKFSNTYANFQEIVKYLDDYNLTNNSLFILPSALGRQWVRQISPYITVGWVSAVANIDNDIAEAKVLGNVVVGYSAVTLTDEIVYKCNSANVPIYAYLANTYEQAYKWLSKGVLYVETDFYFLPGGAL